MKTLIDDLYEAVIDLEFELDNGNIHEVEQSLGEYDRAAGQVRVKAGKILAKRRGDQS